VQETSGSGKASDTLRRKMRRSGPKARPPWRKSPNQKRKRRSSDICQAAALGFAWQDIWRDIEGNDAGNTDQPEHAEQFDLER
jgi:hypothetical protein